MSQELKVCRKCHLEKPVTDFSVDDKTTGKRLARCKSCVAEYVRGVYAANPEYRAKAKANSSRYSKANPKAPEYIRRAMLKHRYNLTHEQYDQLLAAQDHRCALCGTDQHGRDGRSGRYKGERKWTWLEQSWPVDHCHTDGRVRGLLCHACNVRVGGYEKLLEKAGEAKLLDYLTRPSPVLSLPAVITPEAPTYRFVAELPPRYTQGKCSIEDCGADQHAGNLCFKHYMRARRRGGDAGTAAPLPHAGSTLTDDDIRAIRASTDKGYVIAAKFGISQPTVSMIRRRRIWTHVQDDPAPPSLFDPTPQDAA